MISSQKENRSARFLAQSLVSHNMPTSALRLLALASTDARSELQIGLDLQPSACRFQLCDIWGKLEAYLATHLLGPQSNLSCLQCTRRAYHQTRYGCKENHCERSEGARLRALILSHGEEFFAMYDYQSS